MSLRMRIGPISNSRKALPNNLEWYNVQTTFGRYEFRCKFTVPITSSFTLIIIISSHVHQRMRELASLALEHSQ